MSSSAPKSAIASSRSHSPGARPTPWAPAGAALGLASLALVAAALVGCDADVVIEDAAPRVTWVAVTPVDGAGAVEITVWLSDVEGDSVDLDASWVTSTGERGALTQAEGSYGLVGLPTRDALFDPNGQPHRVLWDTTDVPAAATVKLRFVPNDRPFDAGDGEGAVALSPGFSLATGLPEPVEVEPGD